MNDGLVVLAGICTNDSVSAGFLRWVVPAGRIKVRL